MARIEQTKLKLLNEAIQANVAAARNKRKGAKPKSRTVQLVIWSAFLGAGLAYLTAPSQVVSTGSSISPKPIEVQQAAYSPPEPAEPGIPVTAPRPLSRSVFPLSVKKIVIDPGHGGHHIGAVSRSGIPEKELTLDIGRRLERLMRNSPFEVMLTRDSDKTLSLSERVAFANANGADLFVSIHLNWMEPRSTRGLETFYVGPSDDPEIIKLAGVENRDSGYSLADYRRLLDKVYMDTRRDESRRLAKDVHQELYKTLREINSALNDRGVKTAPFVVLIGTQMPAILIEVSSLSNDDDVKLLRRDDYRERIALAVLRGIHGYANSLNGIAKKGS